MFRLEKPGLAIRQKNLGNKMHQIIKSISISKEASILQALKKMDAANRKLLIVTRDDSLFHSLVSIGDIQRAIIKNVSLSESVSKILREDITVAHENDDLQMVKERMKARRNEFMPVVNNENRVVKVIFWDDLFEEKRLKSSIDLPVVIMAGGKGTRLKPLTNVLPKPLIPINDKTIIEDIMDRFVEHGCHDFFLSVNCKADLIRYYFKQLNNPKYQISFIQEEKPLGTAGSLSLLKGELNKTFFVSNCDILIEEDYSEILKYHQSNENEITLVAALKHYPIPYGTMETTKDGVLTALTEKPELSFKINSGMYVIEPHIIKEIPENKFLHITQLVETILSRKGKVGVFPVSEKSWRDMGSLSEYRFQS